MVCKVFFVIVSIRVFSEKTLVIWCELVDLVGKHIPHPPLHVALSISWES
jgi:hypothetical protein